MIRLAPLAISLFFVAVSASAETADGEAFFREKVHPMLEEHCYRCHGGEDKLKGNFRITSREALIRGGDYGPGYDAESPERSILLEMVSYASEEYQMPPKAKLPDADLAILKEWVEMGVPYDPALEIHGKEGEVETFTLTEEDRNWWAYRPIQREFAHTTIDQFVNAKLNEAGLEANPEADPQALIRRAYYDITGLPPALKDVEAFVASYKKDADAAWSALVEDLLARPQFGEKWARHWLDVVRYAETNGFERDNVKPEIWRYRDYVIDAINNDKPYDQFVIEQLAGDEIAEPTQDSLAATGYHRLMQWDDEPADRKQHVYDVHADNVLVTTEAFLATTVGCARCHDHKADPISQKDYYSFMAFFTGITPYETTGTIVQWAEPEERARLEKDRQQRIDLARNERNAIETELRNYLQKNDLLSPEDTDEEARVTTYVDDARGTAAYWSYTFQKPAPGWEAVGTTVKNWLKAEGGFGKKGTPNSYVKTEWDQPEIWMRTQFGAKEMPDKLVLEIYHDEDVEVYLNGTEIYRATGHVTDYETIELGQEALDAFQTGKSVLAVHCKQTKGGQFIDVSLRSGMHQPDSVPEALRRGGSKLTRRIKADLGEDLVKQYNAAKKAVTDIRGESIGTPINAVTEFGPEVQPMHVHLRGSAHALGDEVAPGFPAVLASDTGESKAADFTPVEKLGRETSGRRLALANWIVSEDNPLTARVIMNRLWQHYFNKGIVPSTSDFGKLGELPTHPELLDFLSTELVKYDWSLKAMHRQILMSDAYRRSSAPKSPNLAEDPQNKLLWRHDMRRLTSEEIRDSILAMSDQLNLASGGAWDVPPIPAEVLATASRPGKGWPITADESRHTRRSIYIHVKRSLRHPMMADFDQADTDTPCAVRFTTTVPTQSLAMLNSAFVNDQAVALADRLRAGSEATPAQRVTEGLQLVLQREPEQYEIDEALNLINRMKTEHGLDEKAALDRFALLALNLNEFVYLD